MAGEAEQRPERLERNPFGVTHYATGDKLDETLCGAQPGMLSCGEQLVDCLDCRRLAGWVVTKCTSCGCTVTNGKRPNHQVGCDLSHMTADMLIAWAQIEQDNDDPLGPQQPCPNCQRPMDGLGWRVRPHDCDSNPLNCRHPEFWIGPWGDCRYCSTQEVVLAALGANKPQGIIMFGST